MKRMSLIVIALLLATTAQARQTATQLRSTEIAPGITMVEGADGFSGGNVAVLTGDERVVLIDDFVEPLSDKLIEIAAEIAGAPVDFVINTHYHADHTGGNAALALEGATIVAHDNIRSRMAASDDDNVFALPVITFSEEVTFHLNGMTVHVSHVANAHTDGDAIIHFPEHNVIHTGDTMFSGLFPYIDIDGGGSLEGYIAAQKKVLSIADDETQIIPGHGPLANRADLEAAVAMLEKSRDLVRPLVDAGLSADEVVARNPLAEFHDDWNWGFITTERMTRQVYRALSE